MIFPLKSSPEIEKFKKGLQSENGEAKAQGALEYGESDAISFELFWFMCQYELKYGDSFMWLFSLMKWSCIAHCQNIDHILFCHVSAKGDTIVIDFDVTKMKKGGEKLYPKHWYANPLDYTLCIFTSMGVYFSLLNST